MNNQSPSLTQLATEFFMDLQLKNRSPGTIHQSRWYTERFLKYLDLQSIMHASQLSPDVIQAYQMDLFVSGRLKASTMNRYMSAVRNFLRFLKKCGWMADDPEHAIVYAREPRSLPKEILTKEEMVSLIEAPDITTVLGYRDRTIMELLYSTAIRRNELRDLRVQDINFEDGFVRVMGKGRKERMTPVGRIALKFLDGYIRSVRPVLMKDRSEMHLFLSVKGRKLSKNILGEFIEKYALQAGIEKRVTPHTFRHTCATHMLRNRADVRHIQVLLGHESLNSTQIYTHVSAIDLRDVLRKYHPREQACQAGLDEGK